MQEALKMGYRHIDTAQAYENHKAVGKALKEFNRDEIFITSKYFLDQLNPKKIEAGVQKAHRALKELDLEYLNLFLIHWPDRSLPMSEIVKAMEALVASGKVRHIGIAILRSITWKICTAMNDRRGQPGRVPPVSFSKITPRILQKNKMQLIAYRPFGKENYKDPVLNELGSKHQKSAAQVILRWLIQHKIPTIPQSIVCRASQRKLLSLRLCPLPR